jgi:hypothetical protein
MAGFSLQTYYEGLRRNKMDKMIHIIPEGSDEKSFCANCGKDISLHSHWYVKSEEDFNRAAKLGLDTCERVEAIEVAVAS